MRTLITALADTRTAPWNVVLVVGAGNGALMPALRRLEPAKLVLIEANDEQFKMLTAVANPARGEEVLGIAVTAGDETEVVLHLYSNPAFSSFARPTRLLEILPNLQASRQVSVPSRALHALGAEFGLDATKRNLLVVDAPGQLALLEDAEGLAVFSDIVVRAGAEPLYEGDLSAAALQSLLAGYGFELAGADPEAIYPLTVRAYRRNDAWRETSRLRSELAAVRERVKLVGKLENDLAEVRTSVAQEQARIAELEHQTKALEMEKDELEQALGAQVAEGKGAAKLAEAQQKQLDHLKQRLNHLDEQLLNARDAMALAVRTQTLRENDLDDLRNRYAELYGAHQSQRTLLTKLSQRLVAANEYFQQLAGSGMLALEGAVVVESASVSQKSSRQSSTKKPAARKSAAKKPVSKKPVAKKVARKK